MHQECLILLMVVLAILQSTLQVESDPCDVYTVLNDTWRATNNTEWANSHCDYSEENQWHGWYRMFYQGVGVHMPNTCVPFEGCGAFAPMWINGSNPDPADGIVSREVCGRVGDNCCQIQSWPIQVKACLGGYTVYELLNPPYCNLAYCIGIPPDPTTPKTKTHFHQRLRLKVTLRKDLPPSAMATFVQQIREKLISVGYPSDITVKRG